MAQKKDVPERCVIGAVKFRHNRDGSATFTVAGKSGKRFTLAQTNKYAQMLFGAQRAIVRYEDLGRNPKILLVLSNPSGRLISQHASA